MFALTWPIDLANAGVLPFQVPFALYVFLGWGFIFAALIMTGLTQGRTAVVALLRRYLIWRVGWRWYLPKYLGPESGPFGLFAVTVLTGPERLSRAGAKQVLEIRPLLWGHLVLPRRRDFGR